MVDDKYTRCPECQTVYRVTDEQLALRGGRVRCGQCQAVFDGIAEQVAVGVEPLDAPTADGNFGLSAGSSFGPMADLSSGTLPTDFGGSAEADSVAPGGLNAGGLADRPSEGASADVHADPGAAAAEYRDVEAVAAGSGDAAPTVPPAPKAPAMAGRPPGGPAPARRLAAQIAYGVLAFVLAVALLGQAAYHFRDQLAARWPTLAPLLAQACRPLGCTVGAPRNVADLAIEASDLQADPAHQGLLILTATLRNRGALPLAFPLLELTLTDAQDQVVVRRVLTPSEYAGGTVELDRGLPGNSDLAIKLFIDASATAQAGYRLYVFYG